MSGNVGSQTTPSFGHFLAEVALVEAVHVHLHMPLQVLLPGHGLATGGADKASIVPLYYHSLQDRVKL